MNRLAAFPWRRRNGKTRPRGSAAPGPGRRGISLRRSLPASFAGVALLTMLVLGAILLPLLGQYYGRSETSYLRAGSTQAAEDLSSLDWTTLASASAESADMVSAAHSVQAEALSTQLRIQVYDAKGTLLVDSGRASDIDAAGLLAGTQGQVADGNASHHSLSPDGQGLPSPVGAGLFQKDGGASSQSDHGLSTQLTQNGRVVATLRVSDAPGYGSTIVRSTLIAWMIAGVGAVLLAALVGWLMSRRLTKPLLAITAASDGMARGDLDVRAPIERADEIGSLAGSFNAMAETTQHTVTTLRRFVADAAHELATPLTALHADLELAEERTAEPDVRRLISRAMRQAERLERQSADLLRLSRAETGALRMEPLDLVPLVMGLADGFASRAEQAGIELLLEVPAATLPVRGNADGLRAAVGNLVDNAIKFTRAGGSVTLGAKADGEVAVLWVEDSGIGIPPEDLPALFSRFHRGRNASAFPGSGLGLAIVRATMHAHGGTASAVGSAAAGKAPAPGSRFELRLPLR